MAVELATIARPYARGLWMALADRKDQQLAGLVEESLRSLAQAVSDPEVREMVRDPKVTADQVVAAVQASLGEGVPSELIGLVRAVVENHRIDCLPEIAEQFHALRNEEQKTADACIETAFPMDEAAVNDLLQKLACKFPGLTLHPIVTVNKDLLGGVRVRVGDKVLDGSVLARLEQMQTALTE